MKRKPRPATLLLALLLGAATGAAGGRANDDLQRALQSAQTHELAALPLLDAGALRAYYQPRLFRAAWLGPDCESSLAALRAAVDAVGMHGLDPADYPAPTLAADESCRWPHELLATDAWLALASDLHRGRVARVEVEPHWNLPRPPFDAGAAFDAAREAGDAVAALERLAPQDEGYRALQQALLRFRGYGGRGGWRGIDAGPTLRLGDRGVRVEQLRARLALSGLLDAAAAAATSADFDPVLEQAVQAFQRRANLEPDGVVGALTLAQLNRRAIDRIAQLRANLERWRWRDIDPDARHLRVHLADFRLEAWNRGRIEREHRVIVGKRFRSTPSFAGVVRRVVFAPWWEVPRRLAVEDKLPLFRRDPGAFARLGFELLDRDEKPVAAAGIDWHALSRANFPYRLRQRPGPVNALGEVKILFPNRHDVYLHDTPTRGLFARVRRDFSSGCIRVEDALALAQWLVDAPEWTAGRIAATVAAGRETSVPTAAVPVYLQYLSVAVGAAGEVRFLDDLYGRDAAVVAALDRARPGR